MPALSEFQRFCANSSKTNLVGVRMSAKLVFITGVLGVGGYFGYKSMDYDPNVYPYSKDQIQQILSTARTTEPRKDGEGNIEIWSTGFNNESIGMSMQYHSTAPVVPCRAVTTEVSPTETRVVADCSANDLSEGGSAMAKTSNELQAAMFDEHIQSKLRNRPFERSLVDRKQVGAVMGNMGGMQREALRSADEAQRMQAENR